MKSFIFEVKKKDKVYGYYILNPSSKIVNYLIKPGIYLGFLESDFEDLEDDFIYFLYNNNFLMIRKKLALKLSI